MDNILESIVSFISETDLSSISPIALELTKRHLADAIACGGGAFASETAQKIRRSVRSMSASGGASAYGIEAKTTPELAAFTNASMNRYLDLNDFGPAGHPSDMAPSQLAMAEDVGASGADVARGIYVAYEIATAMADAVPPRAMPWDVGLYYSVAAAGGIASILGLSPEAAANAISLSLVPSIPMRVTRRSPVAEWRSSATAHACMTAVFACRLAREGLTGPPEPFEGAHGLFEAGVGPFTLEMGAGRAGSRPSAAERGSLKRYEACFLAQSGIDAALRLRKAIDGAELRRVSIATTHDTWSYIGGGSGDAPQKWNPGSREMADHSLPYIVACAFLDGTIDGGTFSERTLRRRHWEPLIQRVEVSADPTLSTGRDAQLNPIRVTVELATGTVLSELSTFPYDTSGATALGAPVARQKFWELAGRVLPEPRVEELHDLLMDLEALPDLVRLGALLRAFSSS